jgi:DNA-binding MurR/RpiR family transcriptional regulator
MPKHDKFLAALLSAPTIQAAAKLAGISEATALRYLKEPEFAGAYRDARREMVALAITGLQRASGDAVGVLLAVANDPDAPASSRVSAARCILDTALRAVEIEDVAVRVSALEVLLREQK